MQQIFSHTPVWVFFLFGVLFAFGFKIFPLGLWLIGLATSTFTGYKLFPVKGLTYHPLQKHFFIPGGWLPLVVIMVIFFTKYTVAIMHGFNSTLVNNHIFILSLSLAYGCFSGYFVSRAVSLVIAKKHCEHNVK
jgi:hypothetical protein